MRYVKTFEEMWPFKKESEVDKNKKALVSICKYLLDHCKTILQSKVKRVEVGYSTKKELTFIIQIFTETSDVIRFFFKMNAEYKVVEFENYYVIREGKLILHSLKQKIDRANLEDYIELNGVLKKINEFLKSNKLLVE